MADNTTLDTMSGGDVIATDDIAGVKYQRVKVGFGADGSFNEVTSTSINPLPVTTAAPSTGATELAKAVDAASSGSDVGIANLVVRDDALTTLTPVDGDYVQQRCNSVGATWVAVNGTVTVDLGANNDVTVTSGTITETNSTAILADTASMDTNLTTIAGAVSGTEMQVDVVTSALPTGAATAANQSTIIGHVDGIEGLLTTIDADTSTLAGAVSGTEMQVDVVAALPAGTNNIGDVDVASIAAGTNVIGDVGISGARTSGGTTIFRSIDLDESEEEIKSSGGQIYWIHAMNLATSTRFLKVYNAAAASVTVGTTTPVLTFPLPTQGDTNGAGFTFAIPNGIAFSTGITVAATTAIADNDTGAPGANEVVVNIGYA